ncbi:MAG: ferrous iron transporter B, partial [Fibrobacterota bacterium]
MNKIIVLVGPPNAGKTSIYNHLTGSRYKTVNYPGATVEYSLGALRTTAEAPQRQANTQDCHSTTANVKLLPGAVQVMDTPGVVSIIPRSQDEQIALSALTSLDKVLQVEQKSPNLLVVLVDATQPARHLPLARELIKTGIPSVIALTMNDLAKKQGRNLDANKLSELVGVAVVDVDGRTGAGIAELFSSIDSAMATEPVDGVLPDSLTDSDIQNNFRWADSIAVQCVAGARPDAATLNPGLGRIDRIALHPFIGLLVFVAVMTGLFWSVFAAAGPFMDLTEGFFGWLGSLVGSHLADGWLKGLLVDGIIAGGGAVFVFVPQIAILFLALGLLEDSGYLARGAMIADRFLAMIGLNGKSFVPLLSGNACAIPAAMAARTIPGKRERLLTLLVIPLMSCSARLPVWGLLLGFLIPQDRPLMGGFALAGIYLASLIFASAVATVGGKLLGIEPSLTGFQVELPQWRSPTLRTVIVSTWDRTISYVKRAGLTILGVSVGFWFFMTFPSPDNSAMMMLGKILSPLFAPMGLDWKVGVALLAAFAAREVFVSALAVVYSIQGSDDATDGILQVMRSATFEGSDQLVFTPASTIGLIVFFLIALQCMTTVA